MKLISILCLVAGVFSSAFSQTFSDFLNRVNSAPDSLKGSIVDSFMAAVGSFPYIENDTLAHFIFRGTANSVTIPGDDGSWSPASYPMSRISGTNFWYRSLRYEPDARLDYKFVINGSNWILDALNPFNCSGGFGPNSELRMPAYIAPWEVNQNPNIPHGTLRDTVFFSTFLNNSRTVRIYLPASYDSVNGAYPVVFVHDGLEYVSLGRTDRILDNLIAHERIQPLIAIFIPPVNRTEEYAGNQMDEFASFLVSEVGPWAFSRYRIRPEPQFHATLGASNGGNISLYLGAFHSEVFGKIAAQSSNVVTSISHRLGSDPQLDLQFYLDIGTYDIPVLIPMVRNLRELLEDRGYPLRYAEYHEGHSWCNWRARIDDALEYFFPGDSLLSAAPPNVPQAFHLLGIYPNPFNARTMISFSLATPELVTLQIFDLQGRLAATLVDTPTAAGVHTVEFDGKDFSSGIYYCRMSVGSEFATTQKMVLLK